MGELTTHLVPCQPRAVYQLQVDPDLIKDALFGAYTARFLDTRSEDEEVSHRCANEGTNSGPIVLDVAYLTPLDLHETCAEVRAIAAMVEGACSDIVQKMHRVDTAFEVRHSMVFFYEQGHHVTSHTHFPHTYVATVYLEVEPGAAPIIFGDNHAITPITGMCLISPGDLPHYVPPTSKGRVVLTMDIMSKFV